MGLSIRSQELTTRWPRSWACQITRNQVTATITCDVIA
jgi:hypothetical protein